MTLLLKASYQVKKISDNIGKIEKRCMNKKDYNKNRAYRLFLKVFKIVYNKWRKNKHSLSNKLWKDIKLYSHLISKQNILEKYWLD